MKFLLLVILSASLWATSETIHSSIVTYTENKTFENSKQKENGKVYGFGADLHIDRSEYKFIYEHGDTATKQPPLKEDLHTDKLFLRYSYKIQNDLAFNLNYIHILNDNIAITDDGQSFAAGLSYSPKKNLLTNFTQYYTNYEDFTVFQSDFKIEYKTKTDKIKFRLSSITKYLDIHDKNINIFTKNAKDKYFTSGLKLHMIYESYHFAAAAYFGKRAFSIMDDGFKIQHHAMEFDRTYALAVGKNISNFVIRLQYIYQRATELPIHNDNVNISNFRMLLNYKF